jgi:hypothetical protein
VPVEAAENGENVYRSPTQGTAVEQAFTCASISIVASVLELKARLRNKPEAVFGHRRLLKLILSLMKAQTIDQPIPYAFQPDGELAGLADEFGRGVDALLEGDGTKAFVVLETLTRSALNAGYTLNAAGCAMTYPQSYPRDLR